MPVHRDQQTITAVGQKTSEEFQITQHIGCVTTWGAFVADLQLYFSPDEGTTWVEYGAPISAPGKVIIEDPANDYWKVQCTSFTSGPAYVKIV